MNSSIAPLLLLVSSNRLLIPFYSTAGSHSFLLLVLPWSQGIFSFNSNRLLPFGLWKFSAFCILYILLYHKEFYLKIQQRLILTNLMRCSRLLLSVGYFIYFKFTRGSSIFIYRYIFSSIKEINWLISKGICFFIWCF